MNFRKKDFIIYSIALMLVAAGYFNYVNFDNKALEVSTEISTNEVNDTRGEEESKQTNSENINEQEDEEVQEEKERNIGDAVLVSNNEILDNDSNSEENIENKEEKKEIDSNYYIETRLERNKMYAEMIGKYQEIINNSNSSELQKSIATQEIIKINNTKNAIMICENLILTKDFEECVILINENSVNIVVHTEEGLNTEKVSQIQNIISRELKTEIEDIHISEK